MRITSYKERITQIEGSLKRLHEVIEHLDKDIEKLRVEAVRTTEIYQKLETDVLTQDKDTCKYNLSLMYRNLLDWHIKLMSIAEDFDGMNKTLIEKTIAKLQYEHELEKLKELIEGSGDK